MNVLSLFDGMSCGMLAMMDAGIDVDRYVTYEIDKYAKQTSIHNFPNIEQNGDVFEADFTKYEGFDYLIGGSPCTYWSIAQTKHRETEASGLGWELFSQYVRALKEAKPRYFLYENNKSMSKEIKKCISETFGFEPVCINSALVSAQNRQRLYWVGVRQEDGTYKRVEIEEPEDKGILLKDILEKSQNAVKSEFINSFDNNNEKARTIMAGYYKYGMATMITNKGFKGGTTCISEQVSYSDKKYEELANKYGYLPEVFNKYNVTEIMDKSPTITASCGVSNTSSEIDIVEKVNNTNKNNIVYQVKDGMITVKGRSYPIKLKDGYYIIRKLTVRECARLQTIPDWFEFPVSNSQAYKQIGNGWTIKVISHLLSYTK